MLRDVTMEEISDGKKYTRRDMAKLGCNDCMGCSECCESMGDTIILDPLDVYRMTERLNKSFENMIDNELSLRAVDGLVLPGINMNTETGACSFLVNKRCSIHDIRPGICRLFPLGRAYENGEFYYFLQTNECAVKNRTKVRIDKWIGEENIAWYEEYVKTWHDFIVICREKVENEVNPDKIKFVSMKILDTFFVRGYNKNADFLDEIRNRINEVSGIINS